MNKFLTLASAATIAIATAGAAPALAQDATMTGVVGGAAAGAVIGGPPGAVIGAIAGGTVGATADTTEAEMKKGQPEKVHVVKQVPREVGTYAMQKPAPRVTVQEPVRIGEPLPKTVKVVRVPDYPQYAYANINGQTVVVDAQTGKVLGVVKG
ncbi:outer membrane lipoprotein SlyB [Amorphus suaedae]